jgi:hypothetical protein
MRVAIFLLSEPRGLWSVVLMFPWKETPRRTKANPTSRANRRIESLVSSKAAVRNLASRVRRPQRVTKSPRSRTIKEVIATPNQRNGSLRRAVFDDPQKESKMSRHNEMPPVPPANRSHKGTGDHAEVSRDSSKTKAEVNTAEQGDTANIKQNTTNAGFFKGRRVK